MTPSGRLLSAEEIANIIMAKDTVLSKTERNRQLWVEAVKGKGSEYIKDLLQAQDIKSAALTAEESKKEIAELKVDNEIFRQMEHEDIVNLLSQKEQDHQAKIKELFQEIAPKLMATIDPSDRDFWIWYETFESKYLQGK